MTLEENVEKAIVCIEKYQKSIENNEHNERPLSKAFSINVIEMVSNFSELEYQEKLDKDSVSIFQKIRILAEINMDETVVQSTKDLNYLENHKLLKELCNNLKSKYSEDNFRQDALQLIAKLEAISGYAGVDGNPKLEDYFDKLQLESEKMLEDFKNKYHVK